jgi:MoCo/4Fe-4S cofactor protein with predicted Tat translocation signal
MSDKETAAPPKYWKSIDEYRGSPEVEALREREFRTPSEVPTRTSRRDFLKLMGAGAAFAAAGCARKPVEKVLPYLKAPEEITPGNALWYASTCGECPAACGLLVKTREGRPIKLEGNKEHPVSRGGVCARGQASLLNLYDPARLHGPMLVERESGYEVPSMWEEVDTKAVAALTEARDRGTRVVLLTETITSPSTLALIQGFLQTFPSAQHVTWDAVSSDAVARSQELSYGERLIPRYRLDLADVLVTIGADPLGTMISPVEYARDFASRRRPETRAMSRVIAIEPALSLTGTNADERVRVRPEHLLPLALALANELLVANPRGPLAGDSAAAAAVRETRAADVERTAGLPAGTIGRLADLLWAARGRSLVLAGPKAAPAGHAVALQIAVNLLNSALLNEGATVDAATPSQQAQGSEEAMLALVEQMRAGDVGVLLIHGVNPAYALPAAVGYEEVVKRVPFVVSFSDRMDETARLADMVATENHYLESWNDHEPRRGVLSLRQPAIGPLYDTRAFQETLLTWAGYLGKNPLAGTIVKWHDWLKDRWRREVYPKADAAAPFDLFWEGALRDGVLSLRVPAAGPRTFRSGALAALPGPAPELPPGSFSLVLYVPVSQYDGRSANNAWLQELPDPVSKVCWDNYVAVAPSTAKRLGLNGMTEAVLASDVVLVDAGHAKLELPVVIQPGMHPDVVAVAVGYGRTDVGRVGNKVGGNAYALAQATGGRIGWSGIPVRLTKTGHRTPLALVQGQQHTHGPKPDLSRPIIFEATYDEYLRDPAAGNERQREYETMWSHHKFPVHKWGMSIDMNACIGCSACVVSCMAENNVPVVGKKVVLQGREMFWLRIDRYYSGDAEHPQTTHQPMLCQQCENAPCETVCPVLATVHSSEGLNIQIYNRCVGTRYCSNNCPYKVRRFNWFHYESVRAKSLRLVLNPDVTVRTAGIMEKCTFCVQRIRDGKERAKALGVPVKDGWIETACQQSCPTQAIHFGDMNDPKSGVRERSQNPRGYNVLAELNTLPSITYQTKIRNREPGGAA